jgi:DNA-binding response OmpR family regulator
MAEKLLIVENDPITRRNLTYFLNREGYEVAYTSNGIQALERLSEENFNLVITDFITPRVDGLNLTVLIHSIAPQTPVIIMSGEEDVSKTNALRVGAVDLIEKPLVFETLLAKIKLHLMRES